MSDVVNVTKLIEIKYAESTRFIGAHDPHDFLRH